MECSFTASKQPLMFHKVRNYESMLFLNGDFMYSFVGLTGKTYTMYMKRISNVFTFFLKMFQLLRVYVLCVGDDISTVPLMVQS